MPGLLIDTSFIVALQFPGDNYHERARQFGLLSNDEALLPEVALTEIAYLLRRNGGVIAVERFLDDLSEGQTTLQNLTPVDIQRAKSILVEYSDARLDFVDCCIIALAERLKINRICTCDRRDFSIVHPTHCEYFELLL